MRLKYRIIKNCLILKRVPGTCILYGKHPSLRYVKLENRSISSLVSFSLECDMTKTRDRLDVKYIIWAINFYIMGEGCFKVFEPFELRKKFLLYNMQNSCT